LDKVETALLSNRLTTTLLVLVDILGVRGFLVGAATMDSVWRGRLVMGVAQTVQMDQMNPPTCVVHLPAPVIQTFVFKRDRRFSQVKTAETAILWMILVGAATVDSV